MGVDLKARNLAQVSINMTDFEQTPLHRVFEMVKREAERYGVSIVGSEIVGLIPKRAIEITADFYLQLENFSPAQVFENRMQASLSGGALCRRSRQTRIARSAFSRCRRRSNRRSRRRLGQRARWRAGRKSRPDGRRAFAQKKAQAAHVDQLSDAVAEFHATSKFLSEAVDRDAASFEHVMTAYKLPQETSEQKTHRDEAIQLALHGAATVPLEVARKAADAFDRLGSLRAISSARWLRTSAWAV